MDSFDDLHPETREASIVQHLTYLLRTFSKKSTEKMSEKEMGKSDDVFDWKQVGKVEMSVRDLTEVLICVLELDSTLKHGLLKCKLHADPYLHPHRLSHSMRCFLLDSLPSIIISELVRNARNEDPAHLHFGITPNSGSFAPLSLKDIASAAHFSLLERSQIATQLEFMRESQFGDDLVLIYARHYAFKYFRVPFLPPLFFSRAFPTITTLLPSHHRNWPTPSPFSMPSSSTALPTPLPPPSPSRSHSCPWFSSHKVIEIALDRSLGGRCG